MALLLPLCAEQNYVMLLQIRRQWQTIILTLNSKDRPFCHLVRENPRTVVKFVFGSWSDRPQQMQGVQQLRWFSTAKPCLQHTYMMMIGTVFSCVIYLYTMSLVHSKKYEHVKCGHLCFEAWCGNLLNYTPIMSRFDNWLTPGLGTLNIPGLFFIYILD